MTTAAERLIERQLSKATATGVVDLQRLRELVVIAYEDHHRARRRTEQSAEIMAAEIEEANAALERSVDKLRSQNDRFELALDNMANGLALLDSSGRVMVVNRRGCEILGLPNDGSCEGLSYEAFLRASPLLDERSVQERLGLVAKQEEIHTEQVLLDGRHVRIVIRPTADGGFLVSSEDVTERNVSAARIAFLAYHDTLTELPNRRMFAERLDRSSVIGTHYALLCIDLDGFKPVNDTFGHAAGDMLLYAVATRLKRCIRPGDMVARLGGDEFAVFLCSDVSAADSVASRMIQTLKLPFDLDGSSVQIGASVGIAIAPDDADTADGVMRCADLALYNAKETGRGRFVRFEPTMFTSREERRTLEQELGVALIRSQFELYYQPRVSAENAEIVGFEALIRWHHPTRGTISPNEFILAAEDNNSIVEIGNWVLRRACQEALGWPENIAIAINVSATQIRNRSLYDDVVAALNETGLRADRLELEITETALLSDSVAALEVMQRVQAIGVKVSMDDFGTGYSSLSYLQSFPFDRIKIDRSFIGALGRDPKALAIVRAVIGLCHSLNIAVTAEGVETLEQRNILWAERCGELQGYLFSPPVRSVDALRMASQSIVTFPAFPHPKGMTPTDRKCRIERAAV